MKQLCFFLLAAMASAQSPAHQPPGTIVVDASEFYHRIPAGDNIGGGPGSNAGWLFNNSILNLAAKEDAVAKINVREPGTYRLFVRAQGSAGSGFRVSVDDKLADGTFGDAAMAWTPASSLGNCFGSTG